MKMLYTIKDDTVLRFGDLYSTWMKLTVPELQAYIGFTILMGMVQLPALEDYWSKDNTFRYGMVADRISRDRFLYT